MDDVLNAYPNFAREVSDKILSRLRSERESINLKKDPVYRVDDSDSEFEFSNPDDKESQSEPGSAECMSPYAQEDNDSLAEEIEPAYERRIQESANELAPTRLEAKASNEDLDQGSEQDA